MPGNQVCNTGRRYFIRQAVLAWVFLYLPLKAKVMLNPKGVIIRVSRFSVDGTVNRLVELLKNKGATIYAVINQQDELSKAGIAIPAMQFVLFCSPKAGGTIIVENSIASLDLPLKVLVWEGKNKV